MTINIIIDADPIVYRSGFAAESTEWRVIAEDQEGQIVEGYFRPEEDMSADAKAKAWVEKNSLKVLEKERIVVPESVSHALHLVNQELEGIKAAAADKFHGRVIKARMYLSGSDNYRYKLATIKPYKGNRDPSHKPYHYLAIREFLVKKGATVVRGREADDEVSIVARTLQAPDFAIATIDKDLDQIKGWHYDYRQKVWYYINEPEAERWFWVQALAGDATDNIGGCYKIGQTKAERYIDEVTREDFNSKAIWDAVVLKYKESQQLAGCPYKDLNAEKVALENARLVYIQHNPGELWNPPGTEFGTLPTVHVDD